MSVKIAIDYDSNDDYSEKLSGIINKMERDYFIVDDIQVEEA